MGCLASGRNSVELRARFRQDTRSEYNNGILLCGGHCFLAQVQLSHCYGNAAQKSNVGRATRVLLSAEVFLCYYQRLLNLDLHFLHFLLFVFS